jgi:DMSO reductase anchor subunit
MMIYQDTRRTFWQPAITALKFTGTTLLLGPATILLTMGTQAMLMPSVVAASAFTQIVRLLCCWLILITAIKLAWESSVFLHLRTRKWTNMKRTALLMLGPLKWMTIARFACGAIGGIALPLAAWNGFFNLPIAAGIALLPLLGELLERHQFFTAVIPPKMPGGVAS